MGCGLVARVSDHLLSMRIILLLLSGICFLHAGMLAQSLEVWPLYHSASITITLPSGFDTDKNSTCQIEYKASDSTQWLLAYQADRIEWEGESSFRISLFDLHPDTQYDLRASISDSIPVVSHWTYPEDTFFTRAEPHILSTTTTYWVSPTGSGTTYTEQEPGDLKTLLQSGISCGTSIFLMDGIYPTGDISMNLWNSCSASTPIQLLAAPGAVPVLDGGYETELNWSQSANDSALFVAGLPAAVSYTNLFRLNGTRLFPYSTLDPNIISGNYHLRALNFDFDGFVRDQQTIYLKTFDGIDPAESNVILSQQFRGLTINGMGNDCYLSLKGITFRHYGKSSVSVNGAFTAIALQLRGTNHVLIDSCSFEYNDESLVINGGPSNITIQNCRFIDHTGLWKHAMFKKSESNSTVLYPSSLARGLENSGILYGAGANGSSHLVFRNNLIDGLTNGFGFASGAGIHNLDIYGNTIRNCFDGIEIDGVFSHTKVWDNDVSNILAGISLAPPRLGPVYVFRNVFHHIISRDNEADDPYFVRCAPPTTYMSSGIGIKTNPGPLTDDAADLHFINNTFHTEDSIGFVMYNWDDEWKHATFINNAYYSDSNDLFFFTALISPTTGPDTSFQFLSSHDNYYANSPHRIAIAKEVHGQYTCHAIEHADSLAPKLIELTQSPYIDIRDNLSEDPLFVNPDLGNFQLMAGSPLIDAGKVIPGFYSYQGMAPDIGARESDMGIIDDIHESAQTDGDLLVYPNPSQGIFGLKLHSNIQLIKVYSSLGQLCLTEVGNHQLEQRIATSLPSGMYFLTVYTDQGMRSKRIQIQP